MENEAKSRTIVSDKLKKTLLKYFAMEQKTQLKHPAGKKAISMERGKYAVIENAVLNCLKANGESTHAEILKSLTEDFKRNKTVFVGSVEWHMEWVKLDLEARKIIIRVSDSSPIKFKLA